MRTLKFFISIVLDEDVLIEGNDLWVGYKVAENSFGQFVPGADGGPAVAGYGDMFSMDGENYESMSNTYGLDFNWNIATVLLPDTSMAQQQYSLNIGYHFISSNLQLENPDMLLVLDEILTDNLDFVRNSDGEMVHKIGNQWINNIGDWITTEGYLVKMTGEESLTLQGAQIDPSSPITCEAGFTFVSYLPDQEMDALEAFQSILNDDLIFIRNSAGEMVQKIGDQWVNNIGYCQTGEGYLVKSSNTQELIYLNK